MFNDEKEQAMEPAARTNGKKAKRGAAGREGRDKQEAVTKPGEITERIEQLEKLYVKAQEANKDLNDGIKKAAEASGYIASNVRKLVAARVGDKFKDKMRDAEQQLELFSEVGE